MRKSLFGLLLSLPLVASVNAVAQTAGVSRWVEGQHYFPIKPAQPTTVAPGKVEVTEVFSYGCPACYQFYPTADKIKAALPKNAEMTYLHASWNAGESWPLFQRAFLTAEALGIASKTHNALLKAIWESDELAVIDRRTNRLKQPQPTMEKVAAFYERTAGVKKDEFIKVSKSFSIETRIKSTENAIKGLRADQTPTMAVNGKYRFTEQSAGGAAQIVELTQFLVAKETK
jgi:thiol:disulfide interchange protein DsbA